MALLEKKRPVWFAGENHLITLYRPKSSERLLTASCWRCTYSPEGTGTVLCLAGDPLPGAAIYSDNTALAQLVVTRFNQYFEGFKEHRLTKLATQAASFEQRWPDPDSYQLHCYSGALEVTLSWHHPLETAFEIFHNTSGPVPYDVSAVIRSCRTAQIRYDGTILAGEVHVPDGASASSAFLAFSETWAASVSG